MTSFEFIVAERLNLILESFIFSSSSSCCNNAIESKYSSDVMVKQLEFAELEEHEPGSSTRSFNSKKSPVKIHSISDEFSTAKNILLSAF